VGGEGTPEVSGPDLLHQLVEAVLPDLPPYEFALYALLVRESRLRGVQGWRAGKRTIAACLGKGTRSSRGNYRHITEKLNVLADVGLIRIGDTAREGTLYEVLVPIEVPRYANLWDPDDRAPEEPNHYRDPEHRRSVFERDRWQCQYCGDSVTVETATIDHRVPVARGGTDALENLATACFPCNSLKQDRTWEEAAPSILDALRARRLHVDASGQART
jgi:hypothetical protein